MLNLQVRLSEKQRLLSTPVIDAMYFLSDTILQETFDDRFGKRLRININDIYSKTSVVLL
jgi:hypothetical protein